MTLHCNYIESATLSLSLSLRSGLAVGVYTGKLLCNYIAFVLEDSATLHALHDEITLENGATLHVLHSEIVS